MAICGSTCSITLDSGTYEAHQFSLNRSSTEIDVTSFTSGTYGDWLACSAQGTITAQFYAFPTLAQGDIVASTVLTLDYTPNVKLTFSNCVTTSCTSEVVANGVVNNTLTLRIVGDPTIGS